MPIFFTKEKIMPSWQAPRTPPINSLWKETKTRRIKVLDYQKQPENIHLSLFLTRLLQLCDFIWGTWRLSYTRSSNLLVFCWRRWKVIFQTVGCDIPREFKWDEIWWVGQPRHVFHINLRLWKQYSERSVHCHSEGSAPIRGREGGKLGHRMREIAQSHFVFTLPSDCLSRHKPFLGKIKPPAFNVYL